MQSDKVKTIELGSHFAKSRKMGALPQFYTFSFKFLVFKTTRPGLEPGTWAPKAHVLPITPSGNPINNHRRLSRSDLATGPHFAIRRKMGTTCRRLESALP